MGLTIEFKEVDSWYKVCITDSKGNKHELTRSYPSAKKAEEIILNRILSIDPTIEDLIDSVHEFEATSKLKKKKA